MPRYYLQSFNFFLTLSPMINFLRWPLKVLQTSWTNIKFKTFWSIKNSKKSHKLTLTFGFKLFTEK